MGMPVAFLAIGIRGIETMITEVYVICSIIFSVIVVGILFYGSEHTNPFLSSLDDALRCPRCGTMMEDVGNGVSCLICVVQRIIVLKCPQCGYSERMWSC